MQSSHTQLQAPVAPLESQQTFDQMPTQLLYMEDFDPDVDPGFIKTELRPYLSGVFMDLALRS